MRGRSGASTCSRRAARPDAGRRRRTRDPAARHGLGALHRDFRERRTSRERLTHRCRPTARAADAVSAAVDDAYQAVGTELNRISRSRLEAERRTLFLAEIERALAVIVGLGISLLIGRTVRERDQRDLERARRDAEQLSAELEQRRMLEMLAVTEAQFRAVFDRSSIGVAIVDRNGQVIRSNQALFTICSIRLRPTVSGPRIRISSASCAARSSPSRRSSRRRKLAQYSGSRRLIRSCATTRPRRCSPSQCSRISPNVNGSTIACATKPRTTRFPVCLIARSFSNACALRCFHEKPARGHHAVLFVDLDEFKFVNEASVTLSAIGCWWRRRNVFVRPRGRGIW